MAAKGKGRKGGSPVRGGSPDGGNRFRDARTPSPNKAGGAGKSGASPASKNSGGTPEKGKSPAKGKGSSPAKEKPGSSNGKAEAKAKAKGFFSAGEGRSPAKSGGKKKGKSPEKEGGGGFGFFSAGSSSPAKKPGGKSARFSNRGPEVIGTSAGGQKMVTYDGFKSVNSSPVSFGKATPLSQRPGWDGTPMRARPSALVGLVPSTREPWAVDEFVYQAATKHWDKTPARYLDKTARKAGFMIRVQDYRNRWADKFASGQPLAQP
jgi:hypothetical protein